MGAGLGRRAPVPPTPLQDIRCEGEASEDTVAALLLQTQVPRLLREIRQSVQAGTGPGLASRPTYSLPARRSRKLLPRPEALQVAELGQSPVGEKGLPRGSKCWTGVVAASEAYKTGWRPCIVEVENSWPGQWPMAILSPGNVLSHSSQSGGQASPCDL